jgi:hypothetical protein
MNRAIVGLVLFIGVALAEVVIAGRWRMRRLPIAKVTTRPHFVSGAN